MSGHDRGKDLQSVEAVCEEHHIHAKMKKKGKDSYVGTNKIHADNEMFKVKASSSIEVKRDGFCD